MYTFLSTPTRYIKLGGELHNGKELYFLYSVFWLAQCHYAGNGDVNVAIAGKGMPPCALTDGSIPSAEALCKKLKAPLEYKAYL
jgi:hypothetical protein